MKKYILILIILAVAFSGCEYFENSDTQGISSLQVNISGLPALPDSLTYVGWFDGDDINATLLFNSSGDVNGNISYLANEPLGNIEKAQIFLLSVEMKSVIGDSGLAPSDFIVLSGRFTNGAASLSISEFVDEISSANTSYVLDTPTDGAGTNDLSGLWFIDSLNLGGPVAGLSLPELFGGWIYEGWVEIDGKKVSTGRFTDPTKADLFSGYSGTDPGYAFPGEDFLNNPPAGVTFPTNLSGKKVYVTLERNDEKESGETPFIILFEATSPSPASRGVSYQMNYSNNMMPNGLAKITVDLLE